MKIYDMTDSWTNGSNYNAIKMNVTDASSGDSSKLINLLISGNEKFSVRKDGLVDAKRVIIDGQLNFGVTTISGVVIPENCPPVIIYDPSGVAVTTNCSSILSQGACIIVDGCTWVPFHDCADNLTQGPCNGAYGCAWTSSYCEDLSNEISCLDDDCTWDVITSHLCSDYDNSNQPICESLGDGLSCVWDTDLLTCAGTYDEYGCTGGLISSVCEGGEVDDFCNGGVTTDYTNVTLELGEPENPTTYFIHNPTNDYVCLSKNESDNLIFISGNAAAMVTHIGNGQWLKI